MRALQADLEASARRILELERALALALHEMHRDPLTGLLNRRGLGKAYDQFAEHQRAAGDAMCCVYLDLDDFKQINDDLGHAEGDACLQHLAYVLAQTLRGHDVIARVGGDEFVVLLPHLAAAEAATLVERVRQALARAPLPLRTGAQAMRLCAGVVDVRIGEPLARALARADRCLMQAKAGLKNQTRFNASDANVMAPTARSAVALHHNATTPRRPRHDATHTAHPHAPDSHSAALQPRH
ncbi:MAG TPA: GGDEF domain-containing protein [Pseudorhodoferax sp.]|nr:GGDEF domain-containing protein [Pseudorhodoferax sp.]